MNETTKVVATRLRDGSYEFAETTIRTAPAAEALEVFNRYAERGLTVTLKQSAEPQDDLPLKTAVTKRPDTSKEETRDMIEKIGESGEAQPIGLGRLVELLVSRGWHSSAKYPEGIVSKIVRSMANDPACEWVKQTGKARGTKYYIGEEALWQD